MENSVQGSQEFRGWCCGPCGLSAGLPKHQVMICVSAVTRDGEGLWGAFSSLEVPFPGERGYGLEFSGLSY